MKAATDGLDPPARDTFLKHFIGCEVMEEWNDVFYRIVRDPQTAEIVDVVGWNVVDHPIVPRLRAWLTTCATVGSVDAPPRFPVPAADDPRSSPPLPAGCEGLTITGGGQTLWVRLIHSTAIARAMAPLHAAFAVGAPTAIASYAMEIHPERVRRYVRVVSEKQGWLTLADLAVVFGWSRALVDDEQCVARLALASIRRDFRLGVAGVPEADAEWWNASAQPPVYRVERCLLYLRTAVIVWAALLSGGLNAGARRESEIRMRKCLQM